MLKLNLLNAGYRYITIGFNGTVTFAGIFITKPPLELAEVAGTHCDMVVVKVLPLPKDD